VIEVRARERAEFGTDNSRDLVRLLQGIPPGPGLDWVGIVDLARRHGVSPFLFYVLRPHREQVLAEVWPVLQADYYTAAARSLFRERQLEQLLEALDSAGVQVVLLKGAALFKTVYPNPGLRTMGDLDLWVRDQLESAKEALGSLGYVAHSKADRPAALQEAFGGETQMTNSAPRTGLVELQLKVFPGEWLRYAAQIDEAPVWERGVPVDGMRARQLAPEDTVFHVCLHFAINHQLSGFGLRPLLDLELMRNAWQIDWDVVVQRARDWRVATATWLVLDLLASVFGDGDGRLPLRALCPSSLRRRILGRFASARSLLEGRDLRSGPGRFLFLLFLVDRPIDAALLLWHTFFPERQWLTLRYQLEGAPAWRVWLQRLWHPFRVLIRKEV